MLVCVIVEGDVTLHRYYLKSRAASSRNRTYVTVAVATAVTVFVATALVKVKANAVLVHVRRATGYLEEQKV